jgi:hypothetical protein
MTRKRSRRSGNDRQDRFSISVRKGSNKLLRKVADELNTDKSKMTRSALEDHVKAHFHELSDSLKEEWERFKMGHGTTELL